MDAVASVAVVDVAGGVYGWRWPFLVGEDIALSGGPVLACAGGGYCDCGRKY